MSPRKPGNSVVFLSCLTAYILQTQIVVSDRSIMSLKKRALRRTRTLARADSENQRSLIPSPISALATKFRAPFTRTFWADAFEKTDSETLVDGKLLSYAYLEAGLIETLGA
jgi:sodium/potassium-transporting ATPase subunit alpha